MRAPRIEFIPLVAALRRAHLTLAPRPRGIAISEDRLRIATHRVELVAADDALSAILLRVDAAQPVIARATLAAAPGELGEWKFATCGVLFSGDAIEGPLIAAGVSPADAASVQRTFAAVVRALGRNVRDTPPVADTRGGGPPARAPRERLRPSLSHPAAREPRAREAGAAAMRLSIAGQPCTI